MADKKLYVKCACMTCRGKRALSCYYCDLDGNIFVEASFKTIVKHLNSLDEGTLKEEILDKLGQE